MRGTAKKVVGATSRMFSRTVSTLSAKLAMAPERSGRELVKLLLVLDEREARTAVVQDVVGLLGRVGRVDAVAHATRAHRAHVGIEPFRHCFRQDRYDLAALQAELDQPHARPARALAVL